MDKPLFEALPEAAGQGYEELLTGVYTSGKQVVARALSVLLKRGGRIERTYIDFVYEPFREADGSIAGVTVACSEVTDQVLARKKYGVKETRLWVNYWPKPFLNCMVSLFYRFWMRYSIRAHPTSLPPPATWK